MLVRAEDYDRWHRYSTLAARVVAAGTVPLLLGFVFGMIGGLMLAVLLGWGWQ
jgi:hypothetical protein